LKRIPAYLIIIVISCISPFSRVSGQVNDSISRLTDEDYRLTLKMLDVEEAPGVSVAGSESSSFTLPDPLIFWNGKKVSNARQWEKRRQEIMEDYDSEVYGRVPDKVPPVEWITTREKDTVEGNYGVHMKRLLGKVDNSACPEISVNIRITLVTPVSITTPVPVIIQLGGDMPAPGSNGLSWKEQLLQKGWGYVIYDPTDCQPDNGAGLRQGIIGLVNKGQPRKADDWGALRAWAWGAARIMDYLESDKTVDRKRVGVSGLSRYGKAALLAEAYDQRIAIGFIGSSGAGGAKILRRPVGEQVKFLASKIEYHWFAPNFIKYASVLTPDDLPVDAHELIALCAPRPVFISVGSKDLDRSWIDPEGMFMAAVHAGPVYKLLGAGDLGTSDFPQVGTALTDGEIAWRQHEQGHTLTPNWPEFIRYAEKYFSNDHHK